MKTARMNSFSFALAIVCFFLSYSMSFGGDLPKFTIMTEDWEPYNFQKDDIVQGISTDMLVLMLERIGSQQGRNDIKVMPWIRAYTNIQNNPNTILFTTTRTEEREKMFKWVGPIFEIEFNLYALKNKHIKLNSFSDLKKYKIGTLRGDVTENLLLEKAGIPVDDLDQVSSNIQNTKKLSIGRIDIAAQSKDTTLATCKEAGLNPDDFESVMTLDKKSMYYAFHINTPDSVIENFQKVFDELKNEGKLAAIFTKYGK